MGDHFGGTARRCHTVDVGEVDLVEGTLRATGWAPSRLSLSQIGSASVAGEWVVLPTLHEGWRESVTTLVHRGAALVLAGPPGSDDALVEFGRLGGLTCWRRAEQSFDEVTAEARARQDPLSSLHASPDRLRSLLNSMAAAVWRLDASASYSSLALSYEPSGDLPALVSEASARARLEPLNREASSYDASVARQLAQTLFTTWLAGDRAPRVEVTVPRDGLTRTLLVSSVMPAPHDMGRILVIGIDVTEQRELERALRASQRLETVGRLAAGVAHDFNNVLTVVGTHTELLLDDPAIDVSAHEDLLAMREAVRHGASLIRQLVQFGSERQLTESEVEVADVVQRMASLLVRTLGSRIRLRVDLAEDQLWVRGDRTELEQVLVNLGVNAKDAMPNGGSFSFTVSRRRRLSSYVHPDGFRVPPGNYVRISASDTGCGMPPDVAKRAFEPFFTTKGGDGTGLGLATTYGIVKRHGGYIWLDTEIDRGTSFTILLPELPRSGLRRSERGEGPRPVTRAPSILLVEDDARVRERLETALRNGGMDVTLASDADEAANILAAAEVPFDVLVTDIGLPGTHGVALAYQARVVRPSLGVVLLSANAADAEHATTFASPAEFVVKPASEERLVAAVLAALTACSAEG